MKVIHQKSGFVLGSKVLAATTFWQRLTGYMFLRTPEQPFDGIYFGRTNWVHNSFVQFPLDLIFLNRSNEVVAVVRGFKPWAFSKMYRRASQVVEFPAGRVPAEVSTGDQILFE